MLKASNPVIDKLIAERDELRAALANLWYQVAINREPLNCKPGDWQEAFRHAGAALTKFETHLETRKRLHTIED